MASSTTTGRGVKFSLKSIDEDGECCENDCTETTFDETDEATPSEQLESAVEEIGYNDEEEWAYEECTIMEGQTIDGGDGECCSHSYDGDYTYVTIQDDELAEEKKYVRFNSRTTIIIIPSTNDFTAKEKRRYWLLEEEKAKMDRRLLKTVTRMIAAKSSNGNNVSSRRLSRCRGLEAFFGSQQQPQSHHHHHQQQQEEEGGVATAAMKPIHSMITAVMDEQDQQWVLGINDSHRIAAISHAISQECTGRAQARAQQDEEEALDVYARGTFFQDTIQSMFTLTVDDENNFICRIAKKAAERQEKREQRAKRSQRKLLCRQKSSRRNIFQGPTTATGARPARK